MRWISRLDFLGQMLAFSTILVQQTYHEHRLGDTHKNEKMRHVHGTILMADYSTITYALNVTDWKIHVTGHWNLQPIHQALTMLESCPIGVLCASCKQDKYVHSWWFHKENKKLQVIDIQEGSPTLVLGRSCLLSASSWLSMILYLIEITLSWCLPMMIAIRNFSISGIFSTISFMHQADANLGLDVLVSIASHIATCQQQEACQTSVISIEN